MRVAPIVATLVVGIWIGVVTADPPVQYRIVPKEVVKTVTTTETVETIPEVCLDAIDFAEGFARHGLAIDGTTSAVLDLFSDARIAMAEQDISALNDAETKLRQEQGKTVDDVYQISKDKAPWEQAMNACKEAIE